MAIPGLSIGCELRRPEIPTVFPHPAGKISASFLPQAYYHATWLANLRRWASSVNSRLDSRCLPAKFSYYRRQMSQSRRPDDCLPDAPRSCSGCLDLRILRGPANCPLRGWVPIASLDIDARLRIGRRILRRRRWWSRRSHRRIIGGIPPQESRTTLRAIGSAVNEGCQII